MTRPSSYPVGNVGSNVAREQINNMLEVILTTGAGLTDIGSGYSGDWLGQPPNNFRYWTDEGFTPHYGEAHVLLFRNEANTDFIPVCVMDQTNNRVKWIVGDYQIRQEGTDLVFTNSSGDDIMSIDGSGNMSISGTLTQNATF